MDAFYKYPVEILERGGVYLPEKVSVEFKKEENQRPRVIVYETDKNKKKKTLRVKISNGGRAMKKLLLSFLLLSVLVANSVMAESHSNENAAQVDKFETAVRLVGEKKYVEAVAQFKLLANGGLPEAQFNLAILNLNGLGAPKNFKNALYWSWYAYLNKHETAFNQVEKIFPLMTEALQG